MSNEFDKAFFPVDLTFSKVNCDDNSTSKRFNAGDADVTVQSSDHILFKLHRKNLELASGGFPPADIETNGEIVVLSEAGSTLELLFQYVYPNPLPDIQSFEFEFKEIVRLGEAAEKYQVFSAMYICKMYMKYHLQAESHPIDILAHGAKYGYTDLIDEASLILLKKPLSDVVPYLPSNLIMAYSRYYSAWEGALHYARTYDFNPRYSGDTPEWGRPGQKSKTCGKDTCKCNVQITKLAVLERLTSLSALQDLKVLFADVGCWHFRNDVTGWRNDVANQVYRINFHKFLDS